MKVIVKITKSFKRKAKPLLKKYPSLKTELQSLEETLKINPKYGDPLGFDAYKIRLAVKSKGKGKSGGLRVLSHLETFLIGIIEEKDEVITVNLITIYDKSETTSITDNEIRNLIRDIDDSELLT